MRSTIYHVLLAVLVTGCAVSGRAIQPTPDVVKSYEFGKTYESTTGSLMIYGGRVYNLPTFQPVEKITPAATGVQRSEMPTLTPDQKWRATKRTENGFLIVPPESYPRNNMSIHINKDGRIGKGWYAGRGGGTEVAEGSWPKSKVFERAEKPAPMKGSFEFEILYTGKQDQNFNLVYREYVDGLQRADFSQDLSYSTTESDTIQFKSLTIDIKEVTNSAIKFKVLEDGGLPWLPR